MGIFSGRLYCADCGEKMYLCRANSFERHQQYYICSSYRQDREKCTTHTIRTNALEEVVLQNLRDAIEYVSQYRERFIQEASSDARQVQEREQVNRAAAINQAETRIKELDAIFKRLFEDDISGKLSSERFDMLAREYELEQKQLKSKLKVMRKEMDAAKEAGSNAVSFAAVVDKFLDVKELSIEVLNTLVSKIYISAYQRGSKEREVSIEYNFIGAFNFNDEPSE